MVIEQTMTKSRRGVNGIVWVVGGLVVVLILLLGLARIVGLDPSVPPGMNRPGLWLRGEVVPTPTDWSFAKDVPVISTAVQSNLWFFPLVPYSIRTGRQHIGSRLYYGALYPGGVGYDEARTWPVNVTADPRVRIKIADKLYDVKFVPVTDPAEREEVLRQASPVIWAPGMYMYYWRVEPRG
jgi:hypothetical protein